MEKTGDSGPSSKRQRTLQGGPVGGVQSASRGAALLGAAMRAPEGQVGSSRAVRPSRSLQGPAAAAAVRPGGHGGGAAAAPQGPAAAAVRPGGYGGGAAAAPQGPAEAAPAQEAGEVEGVSQADLAHPLVYPRQHCTYGITPSLLTAGLCQCFGIGQCHHTASLRWRATAPATASPHPAPGGATAPATASPHPPPGGATAPATASPQPTSGGATAPRLLPPHSQPPVVPRHRLRTASPQPAPGDATAPATASADLQWPCRTSYCLPQAASASATAPANHTPHLPSGGVTAAPTTLCEPAAASTPPLGHSADEALVGTPTDHTVYTDGATTADTPTSLSTALEADTTVASEQPPTLGAPDSSPAPLDYTPYPGLESIGLWADVSDSGSESDTEGYPPQHTPPPPPPVSDTDGTVPAQPTADRATTRATAGTLPALVDTDRLAATSDTHMQPPVPSTVQACAVTPDFHFPPIPESQEDTSETTTKYTGRHFDYTELRPFWSECNVWQDPAQRSKAGAKADTSAKLQPKSKPYRYVGNLTPGNYLCLDTVKGELKALSRPTFVTDPALMAKTLASTHNTLVDPASTAILTKKLYPIRRPTALSSPDILELACSTHESETFAYVKVQCAKLRHPVWVKLIHYLQLAKSHYATLISFLKHRHKHGAPNVFYPCFAMCSAKPADRQKYHPVVIVSVDHKPQVQHRYQVYFDSADSHSTQYADTDAVIISPDQKAMLLAIKDADSDPADFPSDAFMDEPDPATYRQARLSPNWRQWHKAIQSEIDGILQPDRADPVTAFPPGSTHRPPQ
ncbi:hypothetical protein CYMTET_11096 [Cymbomonas tetramitiformis]|uniref:Uncharacterized protein n=1 Tax=Cymbomonas tetramitiformis TaxID=36881 RepID=A0AAE0GN01_9CHLO|nr:hypothetical protein CYMTET_11096 [Cymbomonas tetramitiformis]